MPNSANPANSATIALQLQDVPSIDPLYNLVAFGMERTIKTNSKKERLRALE